MKYPIAALFMAMSASFSILADTLNLKSSAPEQYTVKKGDTLWDISNLYLRSPWKWRQLWQWNPQVNNPDRIYPGDVLALQYDAEGRPMLMLDKGVKKLSPHSRVTVQKSTAIPTLPLAMIEPFIEYEQALDQDALNSSPIVLGASRNVKMSTLGHILYVKGSLPLSANYGIYRQGEPYIDLATGATLAYETKLVGSARVIRVGNIQNGVPSSVEVEMIKQEIKPGDVLLPISKGQSYSAQFHMAKPKNIDAGMIIASTNKLREFGTTAVVVLNLGRNAGLKEGHILDIKKQSPTVIEGKHGPRYVEDANSLEKFMKSVRELFGKGNTENSVVWTMPKEKVGELMVFKVYDDISYAMVIKSIHPIRVGDTVSAE
ncbi:LysM peptidoglycan-binding domain-containing protein [Pseudoalteromonas sp. MMG012]|uniref:LysM peptidoglycan-binding domain-containing protein n=1 Tax=Pseudoalteromonas sp. MMG012 TaxID=2822686 RepID=UPI001B39E5E4|nr:LysM domain-containing protein [Pseudoalteromonas sp. MMG012]MBQ4851287.1 LysM peptidoglycan-binding domain-containing protein [Pseudoalteromonas sp. MMG012]